ncbi:DUF3168 domain-containing protein [Sphingomonas sp.]|uniref:tail completion protein gp17 n=1 Tax=Sphingomonas sp. TaxID=28214 RepID=UPI00260C3ECE|nr:DUF3168 domain-containing protein [Sphingomonas sp.]
MIAGDLIRETRRAVLARLKADGALVKLVPAERIYPSTVPATPMFPFGRFVAPLSVPLDGACFRGGTVTFTYHFFAKPRFVGRAQVQTAEDLCARLLSVAKACLHNQRLPLDVGGARLRVQSSRLIRDFDEADVCHGILSVEARAIVS